MTKTLTALAVLAATALIAAGCGSSDSSSTESGGGPYGASADTTEAATTTTTPAGAEDGVAVVSVAQTKLGRVIVDAKGLTLYDFHKDKGTTSSCYGGCAQVWPPLLTKGQPSAGEGALASKLGTTKRKDGTIQVTYAGHPLYTYVQDTKPGDVTGNDFTSFGAQWYALLPSGEEAGD